MIDKNFGGTYESAIMLTMSDLIESKRQRYIEPYVLFLKQNQQRTYSPPCRENLKGKEIIKLLLKIKKTLSTRNKLTHSREVNISD